MRKSSRKPVRKFIAAIASLALIVGLVPAPALADADCPEVLGQSASGSVSLVAGEVAAPVSDDAAEAVGGEAPGELPAGVAPAVQEGAAPAVGDDSSEAEKAASPAFAQSAVVDGVTVAVEADAGVFPEGASLLVESVPSAKTEAAVAPERDADVNVAASYTFDIKVLDADGNELQPADGKSVRVSFEAPEVADPNLDVSVYHVADGAESADDLGVDVSGATATAESDGFSWYTVEFTYETKRFIIVGTYLRGYPIAEVLAKVGLSGTPTAIECSDDSLFGISSDGYWRITVKSTNSNDWTDDEWIKVTISGQVYKIAMTLSQAEDYFCDAEDLEGKLSLLGPSDEPKVFVMVRMRDEEEDKPSSLDIREGRNVVIDLNGDKIDTDYISVSGSLTIRNGTINFLNAGDLVLLQNSKCVLENVTINYLENTENAVSVSNGACLEMTNCTINAEKCTEGVYIQGGTLTMTNSDIIAAQYGVYALSGGQCTMNGGSIWITSTAEQACGVHMISESSENLTEFTMNGGEISGGWYGVDAKDSRFTITAGTVRGDVDGICDWGAVLDLNGGKVVGGVCGIEVYGHGGSIPGIFEPVELPSETEIAGDRGADIAIRGGYHVSGSDYDIEITKGLTGVQTVMIGQVAPDAPDAQHFLSNETWPFVFTSGFKEKNPGKDPSDFFVCSNTDGVVAWNADQTEAAIVPGWKVSFDANGGSGTMPVQQIPLGTQQALRANAFSYGDHAFKGWNTEADGTGTPYSDGGEISFAASADDLNNSFTLYAQWNKVVSVSASPEGGGTVSGGGAHDKGSQAVVTATPASDQGYHFVNWTEDGVEVSKNATYSFTVTDDRTLVANFESNDATYTIAASADPAAGGTVTGAGEYAIDQQVGLKAIPNDGYEFVNWTENGTVVSDEADWEFNTQGNRTLVANFEPKNYTITTSVDPTAGGSVTGGGSYAYDTTAALTAKPSEGYAFDYWSTEGEPNTSLSTSASYRPTVIGPQAYVAHFKKILIKGKDSERIPDQMYTGGPVTPGFSVYLDGVDVALVDRADYTVDYSDNVNAGTAKIAVTLTGSYKGTGAATFSIAPADLSTATVEAADRVYDGTELKPVPTVTWNGKQVAQDDYTATYASNVRVGTATVTVTGKRNFTETSKATGTFKIVARPAAITANSAERAYDGTALTADDFTSEGLAEGDRIASAKVEGSQTDVGSSANKVSGAKIVNAAGEDVTDCYDITYKDGTLTVKSAEKDLYEAASGSGQTWTRGSGEALTFPFKRAVDDEMTFDLFKGVEVDGKAVPAEGSSGANWTAKKGSLILSLQPAYLETLPAGDHAVKVLFDDGAGEATFKVAAAPEPEPEPAPAAKHIVTFDANGHGSTPAAQAIEDGKTAFKPADPAADGWEFGGWFTDKECKQAYDFATPVTSDLTLYAKWAQKAAAPKATSPKTGDALPLLPVMALMLLSAVALAVSRAKLQPARPTRRGRHAR